MTLAEVLPAARQLDASEKLQLIQILSEDLAIVEDIAPFGKFEKDKSGFFKLFESSGW